MKGICPLKVNWQSLVISMRARADIWQSFAAFETAYGEPHRRYHNLEHIRHCLDEFMEAHTLAEDPDAVELAIWFHDFVYDPCRDDNEKESAAHALHFCVAAGLEKLAQIVPQLILTTQHTKESARLTPDAQLLVDIDLSILGRPEHEFWEYEYKIRLEYYQVEERWFQKGRIAVLEGFLNQPSIYHTPYFREKYEKQAKQNLAHSLQRLRGA